MNRDATEVLIAGGGPAGLATAIALRQRGVACVVVEAGLPGIDKACGEGLMPDSIHSLRELGVQVSASDGYAFSGIRFQNALHRADARFPSGAGVGIRRPLLHARLAAQAAAMGADVRWQQKVRLVDRSTALIGGEPISFRWLVGADGHSSAVRRWAGLDRVRTQSLRYGFRRHYQVAPWSEFVEIHWGAASQAYCTPVSPECVCVVIITKDSRCDRRQLLADFPELAARLEGANLMSPERGAVSATRRLWRVSDRSVALVGDASGSADSITGEGLAMSFRQAVAVAEAIQAGSLAGYGRAHARIGRLPHAMGRLMLTMDRWTPLQRRALQTLATRPELFAEMLRVHVGEASLPAFAARRGVALGWNLLASGGA